MSTSYPTSLDSFTNPSANSPRNNPSLAGQQSDQNDAIEALEAKVGVDGSDVVTSLDYLVTNSSSSDPGHKHTLANGATDVTASSSELNILDGATIDTTELNYLSGVTSNIQDQIDSIEAGGITDGDKGDITTSDGGSTWTIDDDAVTYAKMQDVSATNRILGRVSSGSGNVEELTASNVRTIINVEDGADATDAGNVGSAIHGSDAKTTPANADTVATIDSEASNVLKKVSWTNIKAFLKTYFDGIYSTFSGDYDDLDNKPTIPTASDTAYDASSWDGNSDVPTKNSIRDKIESMDSAIALNTAKTTNATHTGDATGSGALSVVGLRGVPLDSSVGSPSDGKILVYRSAGSDWVLEDKPASSGSPDWGDIGGTLSDQTDLQGALDLKQDISTAFDGDYTSLSNIPSSFTPSSHNNSAHSETYITSAGVTFENLDANGDVGTGASQVSAGDHNHSGVYQPLDSDLTSIAGLSPSNDDIIQRKSGSWTNRSMSQLKTDLSLSKSDVGLGNVDNTSDSTKNSATATLTNKLIQLTSAPESDHLATGISAQFTANENQAFGDVCYINADGEMQLADADSETTARVVAICISSSVTANNTGNYLLHGIARDDTWAWTVGGFVYLSTTGTTGNTLTQTPPSGTDDAVVIVGVATHADRLLFNPQLVITEHS